jgi:hypothetical protein
MNLEKDSSGNSVALGVALGVAGVALGVAPIFYFLLVARL